MPRNTLAALLRRAPTFVPPPAPLSYPRNLTSDHATLLPAIALQVKKQVGLKCSDQAALIERIFDGQSEMVMRLPEQIVQKERKAKALEKALGKSREETRTLLEMMKPLHESKRKLQLEVKPRAKTPHAHSN